MEKHSSLNTRLVVLTSLLSVVMACVLMFSTYHIALKELTRILDAQMQFLASRATRLDLKNTHSQLNLDPDKQQEELFVDIWSYDDIDELEKNQLLVPQVKKSGFLSA